MQRHYILPQYYYYQTLSFVPQPAGPWNRTGDLLQLLSSPLNTLLTELTVYPAIVKKYRTWKFVFYKFKIIGWHLLFKIPCSWLETWLGSHLRQKSSIWKWGTVKKLKIVDTQQIWHWQFHRSVTSLSILLSIFLKGTERENSDVSHFEISITVCNRWSQG